MSFRFGAKESQFVVDLLLECDIGTNSRELAIQDIHEGMNILL